MKREEHIAKHQMLHKHFDELLSDFIMQNPGKRLSNTTLMDILNWSKQQTINPTEPPQ